MSNDPLLTPLAGPDGPAPHGGRRSFIKRATGLLGLALAPPLSNIRQAKPLTAPRQKAEETTAMRLTINGTVRVIRVEPQVTLLDVLRENLGLTGAKRGCDHGRCGACLVLVGNRRVNSCHTRAVLAQGQEITTVEGLSQGEELHPLQQAFIDHDIYQCGFCTPGQLLSGVAYLRAGRVQTNSGIHEWMSSNYCRCGAATNMVAAIRQVEQHGFQV